MSTDTQAALEYARRLAAHSPSGRTNADHCVYALAQEVEHLRADNAALRAALDECKRLLVVLRPRTLVVYRDTRTGNGLAETGLTREIDAALAAHGSANASAQTRPAEQLKP